MFLVFCTTLSDALEDTSILCPKTFVSPYSDKGSRFDKTPIFFFPYQFMLFATGLSFLLGQLGHLLLDVADLPLHALVLLFLAVLAGWALVSLLSHLLQVLLQPCHKSLHMKSIQGAWRRHAVFCIADKTWMEEYIDLKVKWWESIKFVSRLV